MMPQKKNATICEHLRWAMGAISGMYNQLATGCHAVPYGDVMEVMFMPRVAEQLAEKGAWICSRMAKLVENLHVREEVMLRHAREGFSTASELAAVTFRRKEVPWRVCHAIVAGVVRRLDSEGRTAAEMTPELVDEIAVEITGEKLGLTAEEIAAATDPVSFVNAHDSRGGVAPAEVERMIAGRRSRLDEAREAQARRRARLAAADERLDAAVRAILGPD
jgi:argininosuccinate lyase